MEKRKPLLLVRLYMREQDREKWQKRGRLIHRDDRCIEIFSVQEYQTLVDDYGQSEFYWAYYLGINVWMPGRDVESYLSIQSQKVEECS